MTDRSSYTKDQLGALVQQLEETNTRIEAELAHAHQQGKVRAEDKILHQLGPGALMLWEQIEMAIALTEIWPAETPENEEAMEIIRARVGDLSRAVHHGTKAGSGEQPIQVRALHIRG